VISGAFSKDFSKLLIGDATGKIHLLSINDKDLDEGPIVTKGNSNSAKEITQGNDATETWAKPEVKLQQLLHQKSAVLSKSIKRPKLIIPHKEPPPPAGFEINQPDKQSVVDIAQAYLNEGWLTQHVGHGVYQGPNYAETGWVDRTAHEDNDANQPLLPEVLMMQQFMVREERDKVGFDVLPQVKTSDQKKHKENMKLDLAFSRLSLETQQSLKEERIEIEGDFTHTFSYDLLPKTSSIWRTTRKARSELSRGGI
jgi:hypothetical protein